MNKLSPVVQAQTSGVHFCALCYKRNQDRWGVAPGWMGSETAGMVEFHAGDFVAIKANALLARQSEAADSSIRHG